MVIKLEQMVSTSNKQRFPEDSRYYDKQNVDVVYELELEMPCIQWRELQKEKGRLERELKTFVSLM